MVADAIANTTPITNSTPVTNSGNNNAGEQDSEIKTNNAPPPLVLKKIMVNKLSHHNVHAKLSAFTEKNTLTVNPPTSKPQVIQHIGALQPTPTNETSTNNKHKSISPQHVKSDNSTNITKTVDQHSTVSKINGDLPNSIGMKRPRSESLDNFTKEQQMLLRKRSELQADCRAVGIPVSGNKKELVARLIDYKRNANITGKLPLSVEEKPAAIEPYKQIKLLPYQTRGRSHSEIDAAKMIVSLGMNKNVSSLKQSLFPLPEKAGLHSNGIVDATAGAANKTRKIAVSGGTKRKSIAVKRRTGKPKSSIEIAISLNAEHKLLKGETQEKKPNTQPRRWTSVEDELLMAAVKRNGGTNWKAIAEFVPGRNNEQCLQRWRKALDPKVIKGKWSPEEDSLLLKLLEENPKNWGYVAQGIAGRTAKQCRERFHSHLDPTIKKGGWTKEEDHLIVTQQQRLGNRWAEISRALKRNGFPGRTENSVKIRWKVIQRLQRRMQGQMSLSEKTRLLGAKDIDKKKKPIVSKKKEEPAVVPQSGDTLATSNSVVAT